MKRAIIVSICFLFSIIGTPISLLAVVWPYYSKKVTLTNGEGELFYNR